MAFLPLLPSTGPTVRGKRLRIAVERRGRQLDRRRITFAISRELAEALNWQPGDRIVIALGLGEDRGRAQLSRIEKARSGHKLTSFSQSRVLRVGVTTPTTLQGEDITLLLDAFVDPACAAFVVENGTLFATLSPLLPAAAQPDLRAVA